MIIQTAPHDTPRLAIMMYEHNALCLQFAHAFGNEQFEPLSPADLMIHVVSHHEPAGSNLTGIPRSIPPPGFHTIWSTRLPNSSPRPAGSRPISISASILIAG